MKKLEITLSIYSLIFILFSCSSSQTSTTSSGGLTEKFVEDTIMSLQEVKEKNFLIDSITNHKHGISIIVEKPNQDEPTFHVQAGYNGPNRFETYFHFYVDTTSKKISVDDFASGQRILLNDWRKQNADSIYLNLGMALLESEDLNGLKIGMLEGKIIELIGNPDETSNATKWESDGLNHQTWTYKTKGIELDVRWEKGKAKEIFTMTITKPCSYKTAREIGIGSTKEQVRDAYKIEVDPRENNENSIIAGSVFDGMVFQFEKNTVKSIFIGAGAE